MGSASKSATPKETCYAPKAAFATVKTRAARSAASITRKICLCREPSLVDRAAHYCPSLAGRPVLRCDRSNVGADGRNPARDGTRDPLAAVHLGRRGGRL